IGEVAEAVMQINNRVKTVLCQSSPVSGDLRLRELRWVAGEKRTETTHREWGFVFKVDLGRCSFSPRLSYERMRVARQVKSREVVVNMFAGIGCFSVLIAKHAKAKKVCSIDINPDAISYARENVGLNRVRYIVEPIEGDAEEVIARRLVTLADRVLMPLSKKAYEYLECAVMALKPAGGVIHYYGFTHAKRDENPVGKVEERVSEKMLGLNVEFEVTFGKVVRTVGPKWFQIVLDILVNKKR
ncbi:MAG: class I SAM-dependent methyltransferase, partial [Candidatus Bathyarchaeota archaeon]|nr:class I SAM-dependent methyltransferase [Candidatus Bathyarchaeota archaeon]